MNNVNVKQVAAIFLLSATSLMSQAVAPLATTVPTPRSTPIPKYLVYANFLSMVSDLEQRAAMAGETDPYKFAQAFSRAGLENPDLDILKAEAQALTNDWAALDQRAKPLIGDYRARASAAARQSQPLPQIPIQLYQLQAERTAVSVNHMMTLQAALGVEKTANLEAYLTREVAPHVSLKALAHPPAELGISQTPQSNDFAIQH